MKLLFVCTGNINRSPAGHIIFTELAKSSNLDFEIDSAATSDKKKGSITTLKMRNAIAELGYPVFPVRSKPITQELVDWADYIICMAPVHIKKLAEFKGGKKKGKLLGSFCRPPVNSIIDPHFNGKHEESVKLIEQGCERLIKMLEASMAKN